MGFDFDDMDDQSEERENLRTLNQKILAVLASDGGRAHLAYLRTSCKNKWQFEFESREQLGLFGAYKDHNIDPAWHASLNNSYKDEDAELGEQTSGISALLTFDPLGPLGLDRGEFVEVTGMTEEPLMGVLMGWSQENSVYDVKIPDGEAMYPPAGQVRKLHDLERARCVQDELVNVLSTEGAQAAIDKVRDSSQDYVEYMSQLGPVMDALTSPVYDKFGIDVAWQSRVMSWQSNEESIKKTSEKISEFTAYNRPMGPGNFEKGGICEVVNLKKEAEDELAIKNGTMVTVRSWDGVTKYMVAPVEDHRNVKAVRKANLQAVTPVVFKSMDDAAGFQLALQAIYNSPEAQEMVVQLKEAIPEIRAFTAALRKQILELQKPLLPKYGFSADRVGQTWVKRSLAAFSMKPAIAARTAGLEAFGRKELRFEGRVAIVTGGGRGLGRSYCRFLASRGCMVVVNNRTGYLADEVVGEIQAFGGIAVADHTDIGSMAGDQIVQTAIQHFGKVDIIICNAGQLEDRRFEVMQDEHWTGIMKTHINGHMKMLKAAWPYFMGQHYGRVVLTSSTSGTYGNNGQSNYGAAKSSLWAIGQTLAMEGHKHGINVNILLPEARTRMTDDLMPDFARIGEQGLKAVPQPVALPVAYLCHETCATTAEAFYCKDGVVSPMRLQQDEDFIDITKETGADALEAVAAQWTELASWERVSYPGQALHYQNLWGMPPPSATKGGGQRPKGGEELKFTDRIAVVANAGDGLGRAVAVLLGQRGCKVYVHDRDPSKAASVVAEIAAAGGTALADSSESGDQAVRAAIAEDDQVDICVCNINPLPDNAFEHLSFEDFEWSQNDQAVNCYRFVKVAWPQFFMQKFGRIVFLSGEAGLHGGVNQVCGAAAKGSVMGLCRSLAIEGYQYGINSNCVYAESLQGNVPLQDAAPAAFLCHEACNSTAGLFRMEAGYVQSLRWQRDEAFVSFNAGSGDTELETIASEWLDEPKYSSTRYPGQEIHTSYRPHLQSR